jgi:hypothetical protein
MADLTITKTTKSGAQIATQTITGRTQIPLATKLNPIWWFGNQDDPTSSFWRNPLHNFTNYVVGVADQNYKVTGGGVAPLANSPSDAGKNGWNWSKIHVGAGLPYVSYSSGNFNFYAGWQPSGKLGLKLTW